tara:strand:+ start:136 stop:702 length:567 start_codon:yes stop_codon:yes gene_type:complete
MKKLLGIVILYFLLINVSFAKVGMGTINLSDQVIRNFQQYLQSIKRKPVKFLVTEDGQESRSWFCPYSRCEPTGSAGEERRCENETGKKCYTLALRRTIKWKNEFTKNSSVSDRKFTSKDNFTKIKDKLKKLGLVENGLSSNSTNENKQNYEKNNEDIINQLKILSEMYKSGTLTKQEFEKAKKKLLN